MTDQQTEFLEKTMVFQHGDQVVIWGIPLNTLEIDAHEVDEYLADGWHAHPFDARDAQAELEAQQAEAARIKAELEASEKKRLEDEAAETLSRQQEEAKLKLANDDAARLDNELKERLLIEAKELGITVDGRWGTKTLQEAIDEAKK